jgi:multimeric flavodoxin WrbA
MREAGEVAIMKTLVLKASPKKEGNSATIVGSFVRGLRDVGENDVVEFFLNDLDIGPCRGCLNCQKSPSAGCAVDDDMQRIYPELRAADVVVFATPVYWWHVTSRMKAVLERLMPMVTGEDPSQLSGKRAVLVITYGVEDPNGSELVVKMFESIAGWIGMELETIRYCGFRPVSGCQEKLVEAYDLGRAQKGWKTLPLTVKCAVKDCNAKFANNEFAATHIMMASDPPHQTWKQEHNLQNLKEESELENGIREILESDQ